MTVMRRPLLLLLLLAAPAMASLVSFWDCRGLAFLGDPSDPETLIRDTHRDLIDKLGGRLAPATLSAMAESADPFAVPDQKETDVDSVRKHLKELQEMIARRGWDTPALRQQIAADLRNRTNRQNENAQKIKVEEEELWPDYSIEMPAGYDYVLSRDGKRILTQVRMQAHSRIFIYDIATRTKTEGFDITNNRRAIFAPDGHSLMFPGKGASIVHTPLLDKGRLDWRKDVTIGDEAGISVHRMHLHHDGKRVVSFNLDPSSGDVAFHIYDLTAGTRTPIKPNLPLNATNVSDWGVVPHQESLWVLKNNLVPGPNAPGPGLFTIEFDAQGATQPPVKWNFRHGEMQFVTWAPDGKSVMGYQQGSDKAELVFGPDPRGSGKVTPGPIILDLPKDSRGIPLNIKEAVAHPLENKVAVLFHVGETTRMLWYDMKTGAKLGERRLASGKLENLTFAADGSLFALAGTNGQVYIGNLNRPD